MHTWKFAFTLSTANNVPVRPVLVDCASPCDLAIHTIAYLEVNPFLDTRFVEVL
jgi:hypothetical protein